MTLTQLHPAADRVIGEGEMARRIRSLDRAKTPLGEYADWPPSLRSGVSICLNSAVPMAIWWGEDLRFLYNDSWRPILGRLKHPGSLGAPAREVWPEVWDVLGPMVQDVLASGRATWREDQLLVINRSGYAEEAYFTLSLSPISDESGRVQGVFSVFHEVTQPVIEKRRLHTLAALSAQSHTAASVRDGCHPLASILAENQSDVHFAIAYVVQPDGLGATRAWTCGNVPPALAPDAVSFVADAALPWPLAHAVQTRRTQHVDTSCLSNLPPGRWGAPSRHALVMPLEAPAGRVAALLVVGVNPHRDLDVSQHTFFDLLGSHLSASLSRAVSFEEALRHSQERYRAIVECQTEMICRFHPDGTIFFVNDAYAQARGTTPEQLEQANFWEFIPEPERAGVQALLATITPETPKVLIENRFRTERGDRWTLWTNHALAFDAAGRPTEIQSSGIDITDRKNIEEALSEREQYLRTIIESTPECVKIVALDGMLRFMNPAGMAHFEADSLADVIGTNVYERIAPEHRDAYRAMHERVCAGARETLKFDVIGRRGTRRHMHTTAVPLHNADGTIDHVALTRDITAHRRAEEALRESEERFRLLADNMSQFAWMADASGSIFWYNQRWYEFTGTTLEQVEGWGWRRVHHPDHVDRVQEKFKRHIHEGIPWEDTFPLRSTDGEYRWFLSRAQPIRDAAGRVVRWFGTNTDITAQRDIELELARHKADLERRVEERTAELARSHERLRLSERMASLGTLSAGLGHDMGNLLLPVRVCVESLEQARLSPELHLHVREIKTSAKYLQQLANGLRLMAIDPQRSRSEQSIDLQSWWLDASFVMKTTLPRGVCLRAELEAGCRVGMSAAALSQTVFNLVQNAGEAMRVRGFGTVQVRCSRDAAHIVLVVEDDGPGMSPEVRDRCTEPFFTTKTRGISTGLGLVLVAGLVRDAGGTVEIRSEPGRGAAFVLRLPRRDPSDLVASASGKPLQAAVRMSDQRLRAFIIAELKSLQITVVEPTVAAPAADLMVVDRLEPSDPGGGGARRVVLLGEHTDVPADVVALGARPKAAAIREAIHRVIQELRAGERSA